MPPGPNPRGRLQQENSQQMSGIQPFGYSHSSTGEPMAAWSSYLLQEPSITPAFSPYASGATPLSATWKPQPETAGRGGDDLYLPYLQTFNLHSTTIHYSQQQQQAYQLTSRRTNGDHHHGSRRADLPSSSPWPLLPDQLLETAGLLPSINNLHREQQSTLRLAPEMAKGRPSNSKPRKNLTDDDRLRILEYAEGNPDATQYEIADELGWHQSTVSKTLTRLRAASSNFLEGRRNPSHAPEAFRYAAGPPDSISARATSHQLSTRGYQHRHKEIERIYKCGWNSCEKAYSRRDRLNGHIFTKLHGQMRIAREFRAIRRKAYTQRKGTDEHERHTATATPTTTNGQSGGDGGQSAYSNSFEPPGLGYQPNQYAVPATSGAVGLVPPSFIPAE